MLATRSLPEVPPDLEPLMVAFRAGLYRDLNALTAARPNLTLRAIDASHALQFERPGEVTELVIDFLASQPTGPAS